MIRKLLKDEAGYSLVEVMASILILAIAIIPMVSMFDMGLKSATLGGNYDEARALANTKLEEIKALKYSEVEAEYPPSGSPQEPASGVDGFDFEVTTRYLDRTLNNPSTSPGTPYMRIEVKVLWNGGDKEYNVTGLKVR